MKKCAVLRGSGIGAIGGVIASLCCLGPTLLVLVGLGVLFGITGVCFVQYRLHFLIAGMLFTVIAVMYYLTKKKSACNMHLREKSNIVLLSFIFMILNSKTFFSLLIFVIT